MEPPVAPRRCYPDLVADRRVGGPLVPAATEERENLNEHDHKNRRNSGHGGRPCDRRDDAVRGARRPLGGGGRRLCGGRFHRCGGGQCQLQSRIRYYDSGYGYAPGPAYYGEPAYSYDSYNYEPRYYYRGGRNNLQRNMGAGGTGTADY